MKSDCEHLIFLHVPKCGGTTLTNVLSQNFPQERCFHLSNSIAGSREKLASKPESERAKLKLIAGHLSYGWHELLPGKSKYFTFIRDPIDRIVSQYNYVRFRSVYKHYLRDIVEKENMSIGRYVESGVCDELNNGQVRLLAGIEDIIQEPYGKSKITYGSNDSALLEKALENIDRHFLLVGLQDRFNESLVLLKKRLKLRRVGYISHNVGKRDYRKILPTPEEIELIRSYNQLDLELCRLMREKLDEELGKLPLVRGRIKALRWSNWVELQRSRVRSRLERWRPTASSDQSA